MQDRFKYRVWDKENKCMHYPTRYSNFTIVNGTVVKIESYPIANSAYFGKRIAWEFDHAVIIQCTGLKDKNGELVYFEDFVKLDDGIICIVKQIENINDIEYGRVVAIPVFYFNKKYQTRYIPTVIAEGEKVGSLYENPELLEAEND